jgi:hypothetical protein
MRRARITPSEYILKSLKFRISEVYSPVSYAWRPTPTDTEGAGWCCLSPTDT